MKARRHRDQNICMSKAFLPIKSRPPDHCPMGPDAEARLERPSPKRVKQIAVGNGGAWGRSRTKPCIDRRFPPLQDDQNSTAIARKKLKIRAQRSRTSPPDSSSMSRGGRRPYIERPAFSCRESCQYTMDATREGGSGGAHGGSPAKPQDFRSLLEHLEMGRCGVILGALVLRRKHVGRTFAFIDLNKLPMRLSSNSRVGAEIPDPKLVSISPAGSSATVLDLQPSVAGEMGSGFVDQCWHASAYGRRNAGEHSRDAAMWPGGL